MDNRVFRVDGQRLVRLRKDDVPKLARTIVAVIRDRARAGVVRVKNVDYIELIGPDVDALVLKSDWEKILPFIRDESFNTQIAPAEPPGRYLDYKVAYSESVLERADRRLYERIVGILVGLFPETYPTRPF